MIKPYERLSQVYDTGWGDFSEQYFSWVNEVLRERGLIQAKVLDLACGTGILALALAKCGHVVRGIDISPEMISKARVKSAGLSNITFDIQDIVCFEADEMFDCVTCTFDSINYIRKLPDLRKMITRIASVLHERGLFFFDSNTKRLYQNHSNEAQKWELNGEQFIENCSYNSTRNVATTTFSFSDGTYEIHKQRPYDHDVLNPLLRNVGLRTICLSSWFDIIPYSPETTKLFCMTEKSTYTTI
jgi:ubiquinone/menaquinone biosynthesis C-methylase UbiE